MSNSRYRSVAFAVVVALAAPGCGGEEPANQLPSAEPTSEPSAPPEAPAGEDGVVQLEADGSRFDPAIQAEQVPDGAWYCDMGTVHYAAPTQGDGSCPICGMRLVQRGAAPSAGAHGSDETHGDGHGADHHPE